ncbi:MAG: AAA family ATPase [Lachnospiraceae bacterium]|nr:AAA family ATPase [Lachnospiraceae bacterium]
MNIAQAKQYIKDTVKIYLTKDEYEDYRIPVMRQRPIFLLGAPGIGKTAIMEQIAAELGIALVSYSMTHHTRQSALGLPFIEKKEFEGNTYSVSEYTMSEIIASVYETMEESGIKEGILFLDEINCVSETLAPSMLQFLQYKVFGKHRVPDGWVIVTAGNPPEFNKSVREFDVVTLDRLKVIEVEADYPAWRDYARNKGLHGAILNFLDMKKDSFYSMETTPEGRAYVTARGWEDLSDIITLYEEEGLQVSDDLIGQYIRNDKIAREFGAYYDLYNKYKRDYRADKVLEGNFSEALLSKATEAGIDERLAMVGLLLHKVRDEIKSIVLESDVLKEMLPALKAVLDSEDPAKALNKQIEAVMTIIKNRERAGSLSDSEKKKCKKKKAYFEKLLAAFTGAETDGTDSIKSTYNGLSDTLKNRVESEKSRIHFLLEFIDKAFGEESNEMLVAVTELTVGTSTSRFINAFGSSDYEKYNNVLKISERGDNLKREIGELIKNDQG